MRINSLAASLFLLIIIGGFSCKNKNTGNVSEGEEKSGLAVSVPDFNADSAYSYIVEQITFGPRVPNTEAHRHCSDYLIAGLKRFGAAVQVQEAMLTAYNGDRLNARNIIGSYNPDNPRRILLLRIGIRVPMPTMTRILTKDVLPLTVRMMGPVE